MGLLFTYSMSRKLILSEEESHWSFGWDCWSWLFWVSVWSWHLTEVPNIIIANLNILLSLPNIKTVTFLTALHVAHTGNSKGEGGESGLLAVICFCLTRRIYRWIFTCGVVVPPARLRTSALDSDYVEGIFQLWTNLDLSSLIHQ